MAWYCVQTRPNMEFIACKTLIRHRLGEVFMPTFDAEHKRLGVVIGKRTRPLFPCHFFVQLNLLIDPWRSIWRMHGVRRIYSSGDDIEQAIKPIAVPTASIDSLIQAQNGVTETAAVAVAVAEVRPKVACGDTARVLAGPLADHRGECVKLLPHKDRAILCMYIMGGMVDITFNLSNLESV